VFFWICRRCRIGSKAFMVVVASVYPFVSILVRELMAFVLKSAPNHIVARARRALISSDVDPILR